MNAKIAGTIRAAIIACALASVLVVGTTSALAGPPNAGQETIAHYGFESPSDTFATVAPFPPLLLGDANTSAYWGRTMEAKYSGSWGLWCAGTDAASDTTSSFWPDYPIGTRGQAKTKFPELADYYSVTASMAYTMPSIGGFPDDWFRFGWRTYDGSGATIQSQYTDIYQQPTWHAIVFDLSQAGNALRLTRTAAELYLMFNETSASMPETGTGPVVDDFSVLGYKYGPVTSVAATSPAPGQVDLTWAKPKRAINSTVDEERSITYRVYRALWGTDIWVELTTDGTRPTSGSFTDATALPGTKYNYVVQAWDSAPGDGRGQQSSPVTLALELPKAVLGAPSKPTAAYTWAGFSVSGTINLTQTPNPVKIEYRNGASGTISTVTGTAYPGQTKYTANIPALSPYGTWYMRAVHEDATHQRSESAWTSLSVSAMKLNAPAPRTTMYVNHTYTVAGSLLTADKSGSYFRVNAYKWDSKKQAYVYQKYFPIKVTSYSSSTKTMKYTSSVKLTSKGSWRLRLKHMSHTSEPMYVYSALSSKITVK